MIYIQLFTLFAGLHLSAAAQMLLPPYFPRCCTDKDLNNCFQNSLNSLRMAVNGDPIYNIPNQNPLQQGPFTIINNKNGTFRFSSVRMAGFDQMVVSNVSVDLQKAATNAVYTFPTFTITGLFFINYTLQNTTIQGSSKGIITFTNLVVHMHFMFSNDPCGYPLLHNLTANYTAETTKYNLGSINATQMNNNTEQVYQDSRDQVSPRLASVITLPLQAVAELVRLYNVLNFHCCRPKLCHKGHHKGGYHGDVDRHGYCCDTFFDQCCRHHSGAYCAKHQQEHCVHRKCRGDFSSLIDVSDSHSHYRTKRSHDSHEDYDEMPKDSCDNIY